MPSKRGLGRGLDSLIPTELADSAEFDPIAKVAPAANAETEVVVGDISPNPHQPRTHFDESALKDLAASIKQHGVVQPLVVTPKGNTYELIAGERRLRASKLAGLKTVPVIVRSLDEQAKLEIALIENIQRAELNPIETAVAYRKLVDQFNLKLEDVSKRVGKQVSTVSNAMRLLGLPDAAKRAVADGTISEGHARAILSQKMPEKQLELLNEITSRELSVRQAEALARGMKPAAASKESAVKNLETSNTWTEQLTKALGTKVSIGRAAKGNKLVIEYSSDDELERIAKRLLS